MPVPYAPYIPSRDPPIRRHESKYMPPSSGLAGSWGYAPLDNWARDPILGYVPGSQANQAGPSMGLLWAMMSKMVALGALLMIPLKMMTPPRPATIVVS